jgi:hypothetical protein
MNAFKGIVFSLLAGLVLAGCGGGGGSGNNSGFNPPGATLSVTPVSLTLGVSSTADFTVTFSQANGAPVPDGTTVSAMVSPGTLGQVSILGASPGDPGGEGGSGQAPGNIATGATVGGRVVFRFHSGINAGSGFVTISGQDPAVQNRTITRDLPVTVSGPSTDQRLTIQTTRTTLPANTFNVPPFLGSPYMAEVTVTWRRGNGQLVDSGTVNVSVNPVGATGGFSTLDDPSTPDVNEFLVRLGQGPVRVVAGKATLFFHALNMAGTSTLTVTANDPDNGETLSRSQVFTINNIAPPLPSQVLVSAADTPVYVQGAGGNTALQLEIAVRDGAGALIPDPVAGSTAFNNVRLEIIGDGPAFGERLRGVNAQGQAVTGSSISLRTFNGIAGAVFESGTRIGTTSVRVTVDRADNNVDNGLQDPLSADRSITVSDGRLHSLTLTSPRERAIFPGVLPCPPACTDENTGPTPGFPPPDNLPYNGTYSLTVSVVATDRGGNPVLPGTNIGFGLIDEPQGNLPFPGAGDFLISGVDGNPQEGGLIFTAPSGSFQSAGGGAGPNDTLVIFGKGVVGNADHESARTVQQVDSQTQLRVTQRFNPNDTTGSSVDSGPVLPYVVGRAADGNIESTAQTDERGVASTFLNYPVNRLGKRAIIWAQGTGVPPASGGQRTVADAAVIAFPGIAPLILSASPRAIPGNTTAQVLLCVTDALSSPIRGVVIDFTFEGLETGSGSVDGQSGAGVVANPTGVDGCTVATVVTTGVLEEGDPMVVFSAGGSEAEVKIVVGGMVLQAIPGSFRGGTGPRLITLRLLSSSGAPVPGVQLVGSCTATGGSLGITSGPGITNANGETQVFVNMDLDGIGTAGSGSCTFTTATGSPSATVLFEGIDICTLNFSPPPPGC